jgi:hypothetical protein
MSPTQDVLKTKVLLERQSSKSHGNALKRDRDDMPLD